MTKDLLSQAGGLREQLVAWRRWFHQHPELSFEEYGTSAFIASICREQGWEVRTGVAGTGVIALMRGGSDGDRVALRADMDALPIEEVEGRPYGSTNKGVMHACGHDAHMAMVLGAGVLLKERVQQIAGSVLLVFQPGEEKLPGGASLLIEQGALSDPAPKAILAQHATPELECGTVGLHAGPFMASADELCLTVKGRGGHAAMPHLLIDPVVIAAHLIVALQQVVSRRARPGEPTVLSFGKVVADGATNVIPGEVRIEGTLRAFDETWRNELHRLMPKMAKGLVASMGAELEFEIRKGYPVLVNDPSLTGSFRAIAERLIGPEQVLDVPQRMGAEDFAAYTQVMPGLLVRLGTGRADGVPSSGLHTSTFDVNEDALPIGSALMASWVLDQLARDRAPIG
ncbi:MAG: amidohydrolase [Flavobacteriales bacterium]|nr:amidohydrolase [Flavobacteriales bacterium]